MGRKKLQPRTVVFPKEIREKIEREIWPEVSKFAREMEEWRYKSLKSESRL